MFYFCSGLIHHFLENFKFYSSVCVTLGVLITREWYAEGEIFKSKQTFSIKKRDPQNLSIVQHARRLNCPGIVFTKIRNQNEPKRAEISRNDPRKIAKQPKTTKNFKIEEIWNFLLAFVFQISSPNAQV